MKEITKNRDVINNATKKAKLIVSTELQNQIKWLHEKVGRYEWCGILFYKLINGDIDKPDELVLKAHSMFPMDIGSEAYTEATLDAESVCDSWESVKEHVGNDENGNPIYDIDYPAWKQGLIHTHHSMETFFSGTDMDELHQTTPMHNYYLSLIVNFNGNWTAKVAYIAKHQTKINYKSVNDEIREVVNEKEVLVTIDMAIEKEVQEVTVPDFFRTRYESLNEERKRKIEEKSKFHKTYLGPSAGIIPYSGAYGKQNTNELPYNSFTQRSNETPADKPAVPKESVITTTGTLSRKGKSFNEIPKKYTPYSQVEEKIRDKILFWLNNARNIFQDMTKKNFSDIKEAVEYFTTYFENCAENQKVQWFYDQIQMEMIETFSVWHPGLVERIGIEVFDLLSIGNTFAANLYSMFESYEVFLREISKINEKNKR